MTTVPQEWRNHDPDLMARTLRNQAGIDADVARDLIARAEVRGVVTFQVSSYVSELHQVHTKPGRTEWRLCKRLDRDPTHRGSEWTWALEKLGDST